MHRNRIAFRVRTFIFSKAPPDFMFLGFPANWNQNKDLGCPLVHGAHCRLSKASYCFNGGVGVFVAQWLGEACSELRAWAWPELNMELLQTLITWIFCYFRPAIKWFLRQTTRLCELQRICYGEAPGAQRTCAVGKFLNFLAFLGLLGPRRTEPHMMFSILWSKNMKSWAFLGEIVEVFYLFTFSYNKDTLWKFSLSKFKLFVLCIL